MDGIHDLGGMQGFGPVDVEADEPVFHAVWEGRTFGLAGGALLAAGFNTPMFRHAIERMDPAHYLSSSYYEHWLTAVATLFVEEGTMSRHELEARAGSFPLARPTRVSRADVRGAEPDTEPRFSVGDPVRVREIDFEGHTRCPRYVRGRRGVVVRVHGAAPLPELEAHQRLHVPDHTYGVRFALAELWSDGAEPNAVVHVDLYGHYLEAA
jgi:nitrile hydratase